MLLFTKIFNQFEWERFSSVILHSIIPCMHNLTQFVVGFELHREAVNRYIFFQAPLEWKVAQCTLVISVPFP